MCHAPGGVREAQTVAHNAPPLTKYVVCIVTHSTGSHNAIMGPIYFCIIICTGAAYFRALHIRPLCCIY